jgi:hypothetical protein
MLKLIGWVLKASFFTVVVLVAAHYVTWDGRTVSDQVRSTLSSAEKSAPVKTIRRKSKALIQDTIQGTKNAASHVGIDTAKRDGKEAIPIEDRAELQAVIHSSDAG